MCEIGAPVHVLGLITTQVTKCAILCPPKQCIPSGTFYYGQSAKVQHSDPAGSIAHSIPIVMAGSTQASWYRPEQHELNSRPRLFVRAPILWAVEQQNPWLLERSFRRYLCTFVLVFLHLLITHGTLQGPHVNLGVGSSANCLETFLTQCLSTTCDLSFAAHSCHVKWRRALCKELRVALDKWLGSCQRRAPVGVAAQKVGVRRMQPNLQC